jgi:hypothetical protein
MDIKEIVNSKGPKGAAAAAAAAANGAAQDLHLLHSISQANSIPMSDAGSERGNSPHDSEHSRYSGSRFVQLNGINGGPNGMRYPSPTAMQNALPMLQQPFRSENGFDNSMTQHESNQGGRQSAEGKAFPCSTCGKGFARRSDLARHGNNLSKPASFVQVTDYNQSEFTAVFDLMSASTLDVASSSSNVQP